MGKKVLKFPNSLRKASPVFTTVRSIERLVKCDSRGIERHKLEANSQHGQAQYDACLQEEHSLSWCPNTRPQCIGHKNKVNTHVKT